MFSFTDLLDYSFNAVSKNWKAVVVFALLLLFSFLLGLLHVTSVLSSLIFAWAGTQISVFYGAALFRFNDKFELLSFLEEVEPLQVYKEKNQVTFAVLLGSFVVTVLLSLISALIAFSLGAGFAPLLEKFVNTGQLPVDLYPILLKGALILLLITLLWSWFFYLYPFVFGYCLTKESFGEAFKAFFTIFSPRTWAKTLSFAYFKLLFLLSVFWLIVGPVAFVALASLFFIPVAAVLLYFLYVLFGAVSALSYKLSLEPDDQVGVG